MIAKKKAPYADTKIPVEQSRAEIDRLLRSYGIQDFQWTEFWSKGIVRLEFAIEAAPDRFLRVRVTPPPFTARRKTWDAKAGYRTVEAANWPQSMRCLLHWLKAKLEAVAFGLKSVEDEFLPDLVMRTQDGREGRVADLFRPALESGVLDVPSLPDRASAPSREPLDTESREVP